MRTNVLFRFRSRWLVAATLMVVAGVSSAFAAGNEKTPASARATYEERCVGCHGATGKGDGWQTKMAFWMKTPNFADSAYMQTRSDDILLQVLKAGGPTGMPAYGLKMTEVQLKELAAYVRSFSKATESPKPAGTTAPAPQKPASAKR